MVVGLQLFVVFVFYLKGGGVGFFFRGGYSFLV